MDPIEYDGLVRLIETKHDETIRSINDIKDRFSVKIAELDTTVKSHDRSIVKIKTIGTIAGSIWAVIVLIFGMIFK